MDDQEDTSDDDRSQLGGTKKKQRASNFTPEETALLINCLRVEKAHVFSRDTTRNGSIKKKRAWIRIKNMFNKRVPHKRSYQCLRTKCENLRNQAKKIKATTLASDPSFEKLDCSDVLALSFDRLYDNNESSVILDNFDDKDIQEVDKNNQDKAKLFALLKDNDLMNAIEMDEQENSESDENLDDSLPRHRSTNFSPEETAILMRCVRAEQNVLFTKDKAKKGSTKKKREAWERIKHSFNKKSPHKRSARCLRTKLLNMKSTVKMLEKSAQKHDALDNTDGQKDDGNTHNPANSNLPDHDNKDNVLFTLFNKNDHTNANKTDEQESSQSDESHEDKSPRPRSSNFSPEETSILVSCVRAEQDILFAKDRTTNVSFMKSRAWDRVKQAFNSKSPRKRSVQCLRTKLLNMRSTVKMLEKSAQKQENINNEYVPGLTVKIEPLSIAYESDIRASPENRVQETFSDDQQDQISRCTSPDPLSAVLNSDSGIDQFFAGWSKSEDKDVVKTQLQLLKYQMETAKMERKRVEDAIKADEAAQEAKALEASLRLRAARLQALAAEQMHTEGHAALHYTEEEEIARDYLNRYRHNDDSKTNFDCPTLELRFPHSIAGTSGEPKHDSPH